MELRGPDWQESSVLVLSSMARLSSQFSRPAGYVFLRALSR